MKWILLFFLGLIVHSIPTLAKFKDEDAGVDAYQGVARMPSGPFKGKILNTSETRSTRDLNPDEARKLGINTDENIAVANFKHKGKFWIAVFPKDSVQKTILQYEIIKKTPPLEHAQLRFILNSQVQLIDQSNPEHIEKIPGDFVFYTSRAQVQGLKAEFSATNGVRNHYAIGYMLESVEEATKRPLLKGHPTEQYDLGFSPQKSLELLNRGIKFSTSSGLTQMYHTFFRTCNNFTLALLSGESASPRSLRRLSDNFNFKAALRSRGFDVKKLKALPDIHEEAMRDVPAESPKWKSLQKTHEKSPLSLFERSCQALLRGIASSASSVGALVQ